MFTVYFHTVRLFSRRVLLYLLATALLGFIIDGGIYSVIFNLYLLRLGFSPATIGEINSASLLVFSLSSLPAGALGGRFGTKRMMTAGIAMIVGGAWLLVLAETLSPVGSALGGPGIWLLGGYMVVYFGLALFYANAAPFLMDITTPRERSHAYSMQMALGALAAFTGALLGGFLPQIFSAVTGIAQTEAAPYRFPLALAALLIMPALWALWVIRAPEREADAAPMDASRTDASRTDASQVESARPRKFWSLGSATSAATSALMLFILGLSLVRFLQVAAVGTTSTFFNVYMDDGLLVPTERIGIISAIARLLSVPAALAMPSLVARWGAAPTVVFASAASTLSLIPLAFIPSWEAAGIGFMGVVAFSAMRYPAYLTYTMELVPPSWRATLNGAGETAGGLAFSAMALLGGVLVERQGYQVVFLTGGVLTLVGTLLFWLFYVAPRNKRMAGGTPNPAAP